MSLCFDRREKNLQQLRACESLTNCIADTRSRAYCMREAATKKNPGLSRSRAWPTGTGHAETHVPWTWTWHQESPRRVMANRHRSRGNTCPAEYHAGMSDLKQIPDVSAQHTLSHSGTIFFLPWYQFVFCKPSFWSELALHLYEQSK